MGSEVTVMFLPVLILGVPKMWVDQKLMDYNNCIMETPVCDCPVTY